MLWSALFALLSGLAHPGGPDLTAPAAMQPAGGPGIASAVSSLARALPADGVPSLASSTDADSDPCVFLKKQAPDEPLAPAGKSRRPARVAAARPMVPAPGGAGQGIRRGNPESLVFVRTAWPAATAPVDHKGRTALVLTAERTVFSRLAGDLSGRGAPGYSEDPRLSGGACDCSGKPGRISAPSAAAWPVTAKNSGCAAPDVAGRGSCRLRSPGTGQADPLSRRSNSSFYYGGCSKHYPGASASVAQAGRDRGARVMLDAPGAARSWSARALASMTALAALAVAPELPASSAGRLAAGLRGRPGADRTTNVVRPAFQTDVLAAHRPAQLSAKSERSALIRSCP
jgi:hypothetical protein